MSTSPCVGLVFCEARRLCYIVWHKSRDMLHSRAEKKQDELYLAFLL